MPIYTVIFVFTFLLYLNPSFGYKYKKHPKEKEIDKKQRAATK